MARACETFNLPYIRLDSRASYPRTRLTRWIELCARWCNGGWENAQPRYDDLVRAWLGWNRWANSSVQRIIVERQLSFFLLDHQNIDCNLRVWLNSLYQTCLVPLFTQQREMAEEQEAFNKLLTLTEPKKRFADFSVRMFSEQNSSSSHLNLITLHGAKGTEFDSVVLMGIDRGVLPRRNVNQRDQKESRRLFYVGITRAKSEIHIVCASEGENTRGHLVGPSPLVLELQRRLGK